MNKKRKDYSVRRVRTYNDNNNQKAVKGTGFEPSAGLCELSARFLASGQILGLIAPTPHALARFRRRTRRININTRMVKRQKKCFNVRALNTWSIFRRY